MFGVATLLRDAAGVVSKIRRVAAGAQTVRSDFAAAGGGIRGAAAGARTAAQLAFPSTVADARAEINKLRASATAEINAVIRDLRKELEDLRAVPQELNAPKTQEADSIETQLAAFVQCREAIIAAAIETTCGLDICLAEMEAEEELDSLCKAAKQSSPPAGIPVHHIEDYVPACEPLANQFLRPGIQENFPHPVLRSQGCYFFTLFRWAEHTIGRGLGEQNVIPMFNACARLGLIDGTNCFVNDAIGVLNHLCGYRRFVRLLQHTNKADAVPINKDVHARRVMSGVWPHFLLVFSGGNTWDSLGANAHNYVPAGLREFE